MKLALEPRAGGPVDRQIGDALIDQITRGLIGLGERLPPTRLVASQLGVPRAAVVRAYRRLRQEGWTRSRVGQGTFVERTGLAVPAERPPFDWQRFRGRWGDRLPGLKWLRTIGQPQAGVVDFTRAFPDPSLFPTREIARVISRMARNGSSDLYQYGPPAGYPPLREYIARELRTRGVDPDANGVIITNGSTQGLDLVGKLLLAPGDTVLLGRPGYAGAIHVLELFQVRFRGIPVDAQGFHPEAAERILQGGAVSLMVLNPRFHHPTGLRMSAEAMVRFLELASKHSVPVYEDDFDRDLRYDDPEGLSLKALDRGGGVIQSGSFSSLGLPGFRVGWLVVPRQIFPDLLEVKRVTDINTPLFTQAVLYEFCRSGLYRRHQQRMRRFYGERRDAILRALRQHMPQGISWTEPEGGLSLWVFLPRGWDPAGILDRAREAGVIFLPGNLFVPEGDPPLPGFRLSFAILTPAEIDEGIRRLGQVLGAEMGKGPRELVDANDVLPL